MDTKLKGIQTKEKKLNEFLNSKCDMFSSGDFLYYSRVTGKSVSWILAHAKFEDPLGIHGVYLRNAIIDGDYYLAELLI